MRKYVARMKKRNREIINLKQNSMKTNFLKSIWLLALMLCSSMAAFAVDGEVVEIDGVYYRLYDNYSTWEGSLQFNNAAVVTYNPEMIDPWDVAYEEERYQGDLVIPETVNYNGTDYTVRATESQAFVSCNNLTSVTLPKTIATIEESSFLKALVNLAAVHVSPENEYFTSIDGVLYNKAVTNILVFPRMRGGIYRVPDTITELGQNGEMIGCPNVDEFVIPATVTKIGDGAFGLDSKIKKVTIEDSDSELTVGTNSYAGAYTGLSFDDEDGNWCEAMPMFYNRGVEEVYWGRNLKCTNQYSSPFAGSYFISKVTFGPKVTLSWRVICLPTVST